MLRLISMALFVPLLCAVMASPVIADPVIYNFNSPIFSFGETTPLLNRPPNIGPVTFSTSFFSSATATGFRVDVFNPNPLFSGQMLFDPNFPADVLTLIFNMPVLQFQVDFALNALPTGPFGHLDLITPVGSTSQTAANVGGFFQGGTLNFSSATSFTMAQLAGFTNTGTPNLFAIDNLILNTESTPALPAPSTFILLLSGLVLIAVRLRY